MTSHTQPTFSATSSSMSSQLNVSADGELSISPTQFDDGSFLQSFSLFNEHSAPASAKLPISVSFPQQPPMPTRSMSATAASSMTATPTIRSPPRSKGSQTKRHSVRSSPPQTPIAQQGDPSFTSPSSSTAVTATHLDKTASSRNLTYINNNNNNSSMSISSNTTTILSAPTPRPHSPPTTTPPSIHKSIHALDAKSITLNMEKSTQQMRAAAASVASAAAAAANAKYHSNASSEEFHVASPASPTYSHHHHPHLNHLNHNHHHHLSHHRSPHPSAYFGTASSSASSHSHHHQHHQHHHPYYHSPSPGAPLPPLPHNYHRQGSISSMTHTNAATPSLAGNSANGNNNATGDLWQSLCVRVLPLFNGEGVQGAIEDLNDLLRRCLTDPISPQLFHDIEALLHDGMFTLNAKMFGVTDEKLLDRLVEQWSFFFTYALPYFEAVFLPLRTDVRYRSHDEAEMWNVRNMALQSFRDNVILLQIKRLEDVFNKLFTDFGSSQNPAATAAKMLQMTSLLASAPDHNEEMDRVLSNLKANWKIMMNKGDRRGFAGVRKTRSVPPLNEMMLG